MLRRSGLGLGFIRTTQTKGVFGTGIAKMSRSGPKLTLYVDTVSPFAYEAYWILRVSLISSHLGGEEEEGVEELSLSMMYWMKSWSLGGNKGPLH